ncbi:MAG TPA: hypothetical protein VK918_02390, partial [Pyrinomonadaceae bacterium]|nr:hypothetical protein [Pyrinomonadaceae bacterium]
MTEENADGGRKQTLTGLAAGLSRLAPEKRRAAMETSAALAGVSLRVSRDFIEAVPAAAEVLSADDLRAWGELGRKLAMGKAETGTRFFSAGVEGLAAVPEKGRPLLFEICSRQLVLSSSISLETYELVPGLAAEVREPELLTEILKLAADIARRSAKHSYDLLKRTLPVVRAIEGFDAEHGRVAEAVVALASSFANRTGGMTADLWTGLPDAFAGLEADEAILLSQRASDFLDHGGSVTLHFINAGGEVLRLEPAVFDDWCGVLTKIALGGNAVLIAFLRATPRFFRRLDRLSLDGAEDGSVKIKAIRRILALAGEIAETDPESALAAFRSSAPALEAVSVDQFEEWIEIGLRSMKDASAKARRSYFALETRQSNDTLKKTRTGLRLEEIQHVLRLYVEALTGREVEIEPQTAMPQESRIGDGKTIYLPNAIAEFDTEEMDFRLYKVLAAYGAGQIEFGTFIKDTVELRAAFTDLSDLYSATAEQIDAFSLAGYIEDVQKGERALSDAELREEIRRRRKK